MDKLAESAYLNGEDKLGKDEKSILAFGKENGLDKTIWSKAPEIFKGEGLRYYESSMAAIENNKQVFGEKQQKIQTKREPLEARLQTPEARSEIAKKSEELLKKPHPYDVVFLWSMASISLIAAIMNLFIYYTAGDSGLFFYSITRKIKIDWDEIEYIVLQPPLKNGYTSVRVTILAKGKKIVISSWLKDYKEILKRVLTEAEKGEIQGIDREVVALLK